MKVTYDERAEAMYIYLVDAILDVEDTATYQKIGIELSESGHMIGIKLWDKRELNLEQRLNL